MLLHPPDFVWSFKPPDSPLYGGRPRVDWIACDEDGSCWLIEVKQANSGRATLNLEKDLTPGQRAALLQVAMTPNGVGMLAIGRGKTLYLFDYLHVHDDWMSRSKRGDPHPEWLEISGAYVDLPWNGKLEWQSESLIAAHATIHLNRMMSQDQEKDSTTPPIPPIFTRSFKEPNPSPSILKLGDSIPMLGKTPPSERSSADREA